MSGPESFHAAHGSLRYGMVSRSSPLGPPHVEQARRLESTRDLVSYYRDQAIFNSIHDLVSSKCTVVSRYNGSRDVNIYVWREAHTQQASILHGGFSRQCYKPGIHHGYVLQTETSLAWLQKPSAIVHSISVHESIISRHIVDIQSSLEMTL